MADTPETPEHRTSVTVRSGDTHVIGEDGLARNVDAEARDKAIMDAAAAVVLGDDGAPLHPPAGDVSDPPSRVARRPKAD